MCYSSEILKAGISGKSAQNSLDALVVCNSCPTRLRRKVAGDHSLDDCIAALLLQSQSLDKLPNRGMVHVERVTKSPMPSLRGVVSSSQTMGHPLVDGPENLVKERRAPPTASTGRTDVCLLKVAKDEMSDIKIT